MPKSSNCHAGDSVTATVDMITLRLINSLQPRKLSNMPKKIKTDQIDSNIPGKSDAGVKQENEDR